MTPCNLLVGCDDSAACAAASSFALQVGERRGGRVTLLHACEPGAQDSDDMWRAQLRRIVQEADAHGDVRCRIERGRPAETLLTVAAEDDSDAILVGSRGEDGLLGALLGRTPQQLLARAPCSVMLFPDQGLGLPRSVLVGVDGSPESRHALRLAEALAVALSAKLTLLHVHNPLLSVAAGAGEQTALALRREAERTLHAERSTVAAPLDAVEAEMLEGDPRQQLLDASEREPQAMLVLGSRGRGGFAGLLLGSTAAWVATHARCPVLVARERESQPA